MKKQLKFLLGLIIPCMLLTAYIPASQPTADEILNSAFAKASKEHKKVFLMFHASWCIVCKNLEACINDPVCSKYFYDNYEVVYLDVMEHGADSKEKFENPGGMIALSKYAGKNFSMPYWLILDEKGKMIGDSKILPIGAKTGTPPNFIGLPSEDPDLTCFINLLKRTSNLKDDQLAIIRKRFAKESTVVH